jgi:predicted ATPase/DNA-binding CsgD family transcriptional regulator
VLLVLDNCEHLVAASAVLIHNLLQACPSLCFLTTSREPVGVEGEVPWRVPALQLPGEEDAPGAIGRSEAVRLFVDRASSARPGFRLNEENAAIVATICKRLDGMPLAIELAAARTRMLSANQILAGLKDRFRLLTGGKRTALPRHQTLQASVDWSYGLLSEKERVVLRQLAVFAGGFTLDAAETVCSDGRILQTEMLDMVTGLVDRSLLQVDGESPVTRYRLLETIRQYAGDRLVEAGEADAVRTRHLRFFVALAERAQPEMEESGLFEWLPVLDVEHDNIRAALEWSEQAKMSSDGLRLTSALWLFWMVRGHLTEGRRRFELALGAHDAPPTLRASALVGVGQLMAYHGDLTATGRFAREALEIARAVGDPRLEGRALDTLGYSAAFLDPATARKLFEQSALLSRNAGDDVFVADAYNGLGISQFIAGDYPRAVAALEEGVAVSRRIRHASTLTVGLGVLGYSLVLQGRLAPARTCVRESLATARRLRDRVFTAQSLYSLGFIAAHRARHRVAEASLAESVKIARETSPLILSFALLTHGFARYVVADLEESRSRLEEALALAHEMALPWVVSWSLALLGNAARVRGDLEGARAHIEQALAVARSSGLRADLPIDAAAKLARAVGALEEAESLHHEALEAARAAESVLLVPTHLEALAGLAVLAERFHEGARLYGAAETARNAYGLIRYTVDWAEYEADVARIRTVLSANELRAAWEQGRAMSVDQARSYAARGRGERKRPTSGWGSLTPMEVEVVRHVAQGLTNPEIARRLFVSRSTVKAHLAHIFAKLGVSTRAELAVGASHRGLLRAK